MSRAFVVAVLVVGGVAALAVWRDRPAPKNFDLWSDRQAFDLEATSSLRQGDIELNLVSLGLSPGRGGRGEWSGFFEVRGELLRATSTGSLVMVLPFNVRLVRAEVAYWRREPRSAAIISPRVTRDELEELLIVPVRPPIDDVVDDFEIRVHFDWRNLQVRSLGAGREEFAVNYGSMQVFTGAPLHRTPLYAEHMADDARSEVQISLSDDNEHFVEPSPVPDEGGLTVKTWRLNPEAGLFIEGIRENTWTRQKMGIWTNLVFLVLGAVLAELLAGFRATLRVKSDKGRGDERW
jgi:hypothetical protein